MKKKSKCYACRQAQGKRSCQLEQNVRLCASCCAKKRSSDCHGCLYYKQALKYEADRKVSAEVKNSRPKDIIIEINPDVDDAINEALDFVNRGKLSAGEAILSPLVKRYPHLYAVHFAMGTLLSAKGEYQKSLTFFDRSLKINPLHNDTWFNKAVVYQRLGDVGECIRAFQKAVEFGDAQDTTAKKAQEMLNDIEDNIIGKEKGLTIDLYLKGMDLFNKAFSDLEKQNYGKAIDGFKQVLQIDEAHPQSYGNLGLCYIQLGEMEKALESFDRALEIDPNYTPARQNRKICLLQMEGKQLNLSNEIVNFYKDKFTSCRDKPQKCSASKKKKGSNLLRRLLPFR